MPRSILVVEDYGDLRSAIADVLSRNHYVCECVDNSGAIAKLSANRYETILIAPRLPISSDPVLHFILENHPGDLARVVVMTNPTDEDESPDARCQVLAKPFNGEELLHELASVKRVL